MSSQASFTKFDDSEAPGWISNPFPCRRWRHLAGEAAYYGGAYEIALATATRRGRPMSRWIHGVHLTLPPVPDIYMNHWHRPMGAHLLTHRIDQADYLNAEADASAVAVGAPILYSHDLPCERVTDSVLFMPRHSTAHYDYPEATDILESIQLLRQIFDRIVVCVYGECAARGELPKLLENQGVEWIVGAHVNDQHSLRRMRYMFSLFDFVATDTFGSHIAYAAYFGAKVVRAGSWKSLSSEDVLKDSIGLRERHPDLVDWYVDMYQWNSVCNAVPGISELNNSQRIAQREWAADVLGAGNIREACKVARLLGWNWWSQLDDGTRGRIRRRLRRWFG